MCIIVLVVRYYNIYQEGGGILESIMKLFKYYTLIDYHRLFINTESFLRPAESGLNLTW